MNGGRSHVTIVFGFLCLQPIFSQDEPRNCTFGEFYCPKTDSCETYFQTACSTSFCNETVALPCEDGEHCYQLLDRCDTVKDCLNGADEMRCSSYGEALLSKCMLYSGSLTCKNKAICDYGQKSCDGGRTCYWSFEKCNGIRQCTDGSDERGCRSSCTYQNSCEDGNGCYSTSGHCDGVRDCTDNSDERGCSHSDSSTVDRRSKTVIIVIAAGLFLIALAAGVYCKRMRDRRARRAPQQQSTYHSANYRTVNASSQNSDRFHNRSAPPQSPHIAVSIPSAPPADGHTRDPYAVPPYPPTPNRPSAPYDTSAGSSPNVPPEDNVSSGPSPATAPPPSYEALFPHK